MARSRDYNEYLIERLKDPKEAAAYLNAILEDYDAKVFLKALKKVAEAHGGISRLAKKIRKTREGTHKVLSQKGNPRLDTLGSMLAALKLRILIQPTKLAMKKQVSKR